MNITRNLIVAVLMTVVTTLILGILYPLAITAIAQVAFPNQANGQLIERNGTVIGSRIIAQGFSSPGYFRPRASAAGTGYDAANSAGTQLGPTNKKLIDAVTANVEAARKENPNTPVPIDLVTTSASGLDPHLSPAAADFQVPRVARERGIPEADVRRLVEANTAGRQLGFSWRAPRQCPRAQPRAGRATSGQEAMRIAYVASARVTGPMMFARRRSMRAAMITAPRLRRAPGLARPSKISRRAWHVLGPDPPAGCRQQSSCDGEPHPGAKRHLAGCAAAVEALEQVIELARIQSRAMVRDGDAQSVPFHARMDENRPIRRRILRRVLEQVRQCNRREARIDLHLHVPHRRPHPVRAPRAHVGCVPRRHRRHRRRRPTAGPRGSPPSRSAPCRGCPAADRVSRSSSVMARPVCTRRSSGGRSSRRFSTATRMAVNGVLRS